jgi:hypothetical protein
MAVAAKSLVPIKFSFPFNNLGNEELPTLRDMRFPGRWIYEILSTHERTNRSRLSHFGFLGLKVMNLLNRTWATGAIPMGAPGWPEFALKVASTYCESIGSQYSVCKAYRKALRFLDQSLELWRGSLFRLEFHTARSRMVLMAS